MRRQQSYQVPRSTPDDSVAATPVRTSRVDTDDRAVVLDRNADGAELEIGPFTTSRGARWSRTETLLGLGLAGILLGGVVLNALSNVGKASPTTNPSGFAECAPIQDALIGSHATLRAVGRDVAVEGRAGTTRSTDLGSPDDWLPPTDEGLEIGLGTPLEAVSGADCVIGWSMWAVPTKDVLVNVKATMVRLGSAMLSATAAPVAVPGPAADGDWTLRLATAYQTRSGKTQWSVKYFRVVVGGAPYQAPIAPTPRPTPVPTPAITPAVPCMAPVQGSGPPEVSLIVEGQDPIEGTIGAMTWFGAENSPGDLELVELATLPYNGKVELRIGNDICATRWAISSMALQEPLAVFNEGNYNVNAALATFGTNRQDNPVIAQQNRIPMTTVGLGKVIIRAILNFEGGQALQVYWRVKISAFDPPPLRLVGPGGTAITPVVGCGVAIYGSDNGWNEECPSPAWPILDNASLLTVHENAILTLESPAWTIEYWNFTWAEQASVQAGGDPAVGGNVGGQDMVAKDLVRFLVPEQGDWTVQIYLTHTEGDQQFNLPLYFRLRVLP